MKTLLRARIVLLAFVCLLLLLIPRGASAQITAGAGGGDSFKPMPSDPYGDSVSNGASGPVLHDSDNLADPGGTPAPSLALDKPAPLPPTSAVSFVTVSGGHFAVDGHAFRHVGTNEVDLIYEGGDQWNDTYYLRQAGVKQVRVFLPNNHYNTQDMINRLENALGIAWSRGIRLTVVLSNFYYGNHWGSDGGGGFTVVPGDEGYYTDTCCGGIHLLNHSWFTGGYNVNYKPFVGTVVDHFKNDGRVFAWEIGNELGAPNGDIEGTIAFYRAMALYIKSIDPNHMVAPGIICTSWLPLTTADQKYRLYQYMDYVTEHHYEPGGNPGDLNDDQLAALYNKPLVIEEFGVAQNQSPFTDHDRILPRVIDFYDWAHAGATARQADAVMVWGVDFGNDHGSGDAYVGPWEQGLSDQYVQVWRDNADWSRVAPRYSDVPPTDTFYTYIECLSRHRAVSGVAGWVDDSNNDQFRPGAAVTRVQAIKAIIRAMGLPLQFPATATFTDVPRSHPDFRYVETAVYYGIINGYADHTFRPDAGLTRGQMCKVIVIAGQVRYGWSINTTGAPHFVDVPQGSTFFDWIETAYNRQMINGYANGYFYPNNPTTRGQLAKMLSQAIQCQ
jgi:S-layer family protein